MAIALPLLAWQASRGLLSFSNVLTIGAVVGQVPFVLIVAGILIVQAVQGPLSWDVARHWYGWFGTARALVLGLLIGPSAAIAFWAVGIWGTELDASHSQQIR